MLSLSELSFFLTIIGFFFLSLSVSLELSFILATGLTSGAAFAGGLDFLGKGLSSLLLLSALLDTVGFGGAGFYAYTGFFPQSLLLLLEVFFFTGGLLYGASCFGYVFGFTGGGEDDELDAL